MEKLCECGCGEMAARARQTDTKRGIIKGQSLRFVHGHHQRTREYQDLVQQHRGHLQGSNHYNWSGGRVKRQDGYIEILLPEHPNAHKNGYVMEHIAMASAVLGRPLLPTEDVHHINLIRDDNRNNNLLICSHAFHAELHARLVCYRAIGNPTTERPCLVCSRLIRPFLNLVLAGSGKYCSIACSNTGRSERLKGKEVHHG